MNRQNKALQARVHEHDEEMRTKFVEKKLETARVSEQLEECQLEKDLHARLAEANQQIRTLTERLTQAVHRIVDAAPEELELLDSEMEVTAMDCGASTAKGARTATQVPEELLGSAVSGVPLNDEEGPAFSETGNLPENKMYADVGRHSPLSHGMSLAELDFLDSSLSGV